MHRRQRVEPLGQKATVGMDRLGGQAKTRATQARVSTFFQPLTHHSDAIAHQIAVSLLGHVAEMNADAKLDALLERHASVALDHTGLDFDCAAHGVDHAAELDDAAVASTLDDASVVHGDR